MGDQSRQGSCFSPRSAIRPNCYYLPLSRSASRVPKSIPELLHGLASRCDAVDDRLSPPIAQTKLNVPSSAIPKSLVTT